MSSCIASIAIDAVNPRVVADFWRDVLGWHEVAADAEGITIADSHQGATIDVLAVAESKSVKNRLHLDLRADESNTAEELRRLLALGAVHVDVGQSRQVSWVVLADPEGNEFCLLERTVQELTW